MNFCWTKPLLQFLTIHYIPGQQFLILNDVSIRIELNELGKQKLNSHSFSKDIITATARICWVCDKEMEVWLDIWGEIKLYNIQLYSYFIFGNVNRDLFCKSKWESGIHFPPSLLVFAFLEHNEICFQYRGRIISVECWDNYYELKCNNSWLSLIFSKWHINLYFYLKG